MDTLPRWHLMKHDDGTVFGPVTFSEIHEWAKAAQVSPLDKISNDEITWIKAPMCAELEMDWLLQMSDDHYYGPTTLSAIQEFIKEGEIDHDTLVINCKDASITNVGRLPFAGEKAVEVVEAIGLPIDDLESLPRRVDKLENIVKAQHQRITQLESALKDFLTPR